MVSFFVGYLPTLFLGLDWICGMRHCGEYRFALGLLHRLHFFLRVFGQRMYNLLYERLSLYVEVFLLFERVVGFSDLESQSGLLFYFLCRGHLHILYPTSHSCFLVDISYLFWRKDHYWLFCG